MTLFLLTFYTRYRYIHLYDMKSALNNVPKSNVDKVKDERDNDGPGSPK